MASDDPKKQSEDYASFCTLAYTGEPSKHERRITVKNSFLDVDIGGSSDEECSQPHRRRCRQRAWSDTELDYGMSLSERELCRNDSVSTAATYSLQNGDSLSCSDDSLEMGAEASDMQPSRGNADCKFDESSWPCWQGPDFSNVWAPDEIAWMPVLVGWSTLPTTPYMWSPDMHCAGAGCDPGQMTLPPARCTRRGRRDRLTQKTPREKDFAREKAREARPGVIRTSAEYISISKALDLPHSLVAEPEDIEAWPELGSRKSDDSAWKKLQPAKETSWPARQHCGREQAKANEPVASVTSLDQPETLADSFSSSVETSDWTSYMIEEPRASDTKDLSRRRKLPVPPCSPPPPVVEETSSEQKCHRRKMPAAPAVAPPSVPAQIVCDEVRPVIVSTPVSSPLTPSPVIDSRYSLGKADHAKTRTEKMESHRAEASELIGKATPKQRVAKECKRDKISQVCVPELANSQPQKDAVPSQRHSHRSALCGETDEGFLQERRCVADSKSTSASSHKRRVPSHRQLASNPPGARTNDAKSQLKSVKSRHRPNCQRDDPLQTSTVFARICLLRMIKFSGVAVALLGLLFMCSYWIRRLLTAPTINNGVVQAPLSGSAYAWYAAPQDAATTTGHEPSVGARTRAIDIEVARAHELGSEIVAKMKQQLAQHKRARLARQSEERQQRQSEEEWKQERKREEEQFQLHQEQIKHQRSLDRWEKEQRKRYRAYMKEQEQRKRAWQQHQELMMTIEGMQTSTRHT